MLGRACKQGLGAADSHCSAPVATATSQWHMPRISSRSPCVANGQRPAVAPPPSPHRTTLAARVSFMQGSSPRLWTIAAPAQPLQATGSALRIRAALSSSTLACASGARALAGDGSKFESRCGQHLDPLQRRTDACSCHPYTSALDDAVRGAEQPARPARPRSEVAKLGLPPCPVFAALLLHTGARTATEIAKPPARH